MKRMKKDFGTLSLWLLIFVIKVTHEMTHYFLFYILQMYTVIHLATGKFNASKHNLCVISIYMYILCIQRLVLVDTRI